MFSEKKYGISKFLEVFFPDHMTSSKKSVSNREMIIIDFGAHVNRGLCMQYSSLMSRKH